MDPPSRDVNTRKPEQQEVMTDAAHGYARAGSETIGEQRDDRERSRGSPFSVGHFRLIII